MKFYHATTRESAEKICEEGIIRAGWDRLVYLCKKPEDACKFLAVRGIREFFVFEVSLRGDEVEESLDHSEAFFRCKAYTYAGDIKLPPKPKWLLYSVD